MFGIPKFLVKSALQKVLQLAETKLPDGERGIAKYLASVELVPGESRAIGVAFLDKNKKLAFSLVTVDENNTIKRQIIGITAVEGIEMLKGVDIEKFINESQSID